MYTAQQTHQVSTKRFLLLLSLAIVLSLSSGLVANYCSTKPIYKPFKKQDYALDHHPPQEVQRSSYSL